MAKGHFTHLPVVACKECGQPTTSKYGYCDREPACHVLNKRESYRATHAAPPAYCLGCGDQIARPRGRYICPKPECRALGMRLTRLLSRLEVLTDGVL